MSFRFIDKLLRLFRPPGRDGTGAPVDYRALMENSVDMICHVRIAGGEFRFTYASPAVPDTLGWSCEEFLRLSPADIFTEEAMAVISADIANLISGAKTSSVVTEAIHKDGRQIWLENNVRVLSHGDEGTIEVIVSMRDVTERKLLQDQLALAAMSDGLTGIPNRRAFDQTLEREWNRALRTGEPLSLVLLDVDHFKLLNDAYGHQVGDDCLRTLAKTLMEHVKRPGDFVARYGGEEFAVILPATDLSGAEPVARKICETIADLQIPHQGNAEGGNRVTVSCGVATALGRSGGTNRMLVALLQAADGALYKAKAAGRNRVCASFLLATTELRESNGE